MTPEAKARERQMAQYDRHMAYTPHRSLKGRRKATQRSPILDEILRNGGTLASDYLERFGPPPEFNTEPESVKLEEPAAEFNEPVKPESVKQGFDRTVYMRDYMAKRRAEEKS